MPSAELANHITHLLNVVSVLQRESAGHLRRCGELQMEVDALKKAVSIISAVTAP